MALSLTFDSCISTSDTSHVVCVLTLWCTLHNLAPRHKWSSTWATLLFRDGQEMGRREKNKDERWIMRNTFLKNGRMDFFIYFSSLYAGYDKNWSSSLIPPCFTMTIAQKHSLPIHFFQTQNCVLILRQSQFHSDCMSSQLPDSSQILSRFMSFPGKGRCSKQLWGKKAARVYET